jgi:hypothetical protein
MKKLQLSRETLLSLDEDQSSKVVEGAAGGTVLCMTGECQSVNKYCETKLLCVTVPCPHPTLLCYTPKCGGTIVIA